jgi:hypothetical protein
LDEGINIVCNRLYEALDLYTDSDIVNNLCITGTVAKIIQGAPVEEIVVIPFITSAIKIFEYCNDKFQDFVKIDEAIKFQNRTQFIIDGVYFEMWLTDDLGTINTVTNLRVQDPAHIPSYIN